MTAPRERDQLRSYADVIAMWTRGFDTAWISEQVGLPEPLIERWVWNFREQARAAGAAA
jgi:hypothetical protein